MTPSSLLDFTSHHLKTLPDYHVPVPCSAVRLIHLFFYHLSAQRKMGLFISQTYHETYERVIGVLLQVTDAHLDNKLLHGVLHVGVPTKSVGKHHLPS